ncbi:MAG: hypothetical protein CVU86_04250 [Firmicutes bacterium HGW-Firmicutes-11]|jgi:hypothetical protein|nr:MAG: hypothetical protein CVU86_04250 [Firmicutes bacterium HGW-Firmicutes-11]
MKKNRISVLITILVLVLATAAVFAETYDPGSAEDPVVTKSYVDAQIAALKTGGTASVFEPINVKAGQKLIGGAGTELILRSGDAYAIDNGVDGLSDVTSAKDLKGGVTITANHLLLVPRADGRGLEAGSDLWVMVKGSYTIQ